MSSLSNDVKGADQAEGKLAQETATGSSPTVATPLSAVATPFYSMRAPMAVACDLVASVNGGGGEEEDEETLTEVRAPRVALGKIMKRVKKNGDGPSASTPVEPSPSSPFGNGVSPAGGGAPQSNSFEPKSGDAPENASRQVTSANTASSAATEARSSPLPSSSTAPEKDQTAVSVVNDGPLSGSPVTSTSSNAEVDAYEKARNKILNQTNQAGAVTSAAQNWSSPSSGQHQGGSDSGTRSEQQNNNTPNVEELAPEADTTKRRKMKFRGIVANNEMGDYTRHQSQPQQPHQPSPYWNNGNGHNQQYSQGSPYYGAHGSSNPSVPIPSAPSTNVTVGLGHQHINPFVAARGGGGGGNNYNNTCNNAINGGRGRGGPSPTPNNAYAQQQCYPPSNSIEPTVGPYGSIGGIPLTQPLPPPPLPLPTLQPPAVVPAASAPLMPAPFGVPRADPHNYNSHHHNNNQSHPNSYYNRSDPSCGSGQYGGRNGGNVVVGSSVGGGAPMPSSGYARGGYEQNNNYSYNNNSNYTDGSGGGRGRGGARGGYHGYPQQSDAYFPPSGSNQPGPNTHGGANPFANQPYQNPHHYQPPFTQQRLQRMDRGGRRVMPSDAPSEVTNDSSAGYGNSNPQPAAAW